MKRKMILMMVLLFFAVACPAQSIRNSNNSVIAKVEADGTTATTASSVMRKEFPCAMLPSSFSSTSGCNSHVRENKSIHFLLT